MSVVLELRWSPPVTFDQVRAFPNCGGIYAIIYLTEAGTRTVRIGAAHSLKERPANYDKTPFELSPDLLVSYCTIPEQFYIDMERLLKNSYSEQLVDLKWLEYRMEALAIAGYKERWGCLPPGNHQAGSGRKYLHHIVLREKGDLAVVASPPAQLSEEVAQALIQNKK